MQKVLLKKQHFKQELKVSCIPAAARIILIYDFRMTITPEADAPSEHFRIEKKKPEKLKSEVVRKMTF